jgi:hypothetical protein
MTAEVLKRRSAEVTRRSQPSEHVEHADVADEQAADAVGARAVGLGDARLDRLRPAGDAGGGVVHERLAARVPAAARAEEQAHLDVALTPDRRHLVELGVGEHHHARALGDAVDA